MSRSFRMFSLLAVAGGLLTACADQSPLTAPSTASFAKSGSTSSGGGGGGGGGSTTPSTPTTVGGLPVAPTYVGTITTMGVVPAGFYYGVPSGWQVSGYPFSAVYITSYKPVNGPIVLGACVSVSFYMNGDERVMQEMKTLDPSKCQ